MARTSDNSVKAAAFVTKKGEIDAMLGRLQRFSTDHCNVDRDRISWGDVGTPSQYAEILRAYHR
jgi:hypothetical protein